VSALAAAVPGGVVHSGRPFPIDLEPRVFDAAEWDALAAGIAQRTLALERFVADVHGEQRTIRDGVVPADLLDGCPWWEPEVRALPRPASWIGVAGPDVVRDAAGRLVVLEDNVRTPTMMAYALACREATSAALGADRPPAREVHDALRACCTVMLGPGRAAVVDEGTANVVHWEVEALGALLDVPVLTVEALTDRGGTLHGPDGPLDVVWRRTSHERLAELPVFAGPLAAGTLRVVNAFGTGVADDKRVLPYVPDLVRALCGEEPLLGQPETYDLGDPQVRAQVLPRLDELVLKPRTGSGGYGVLIGPRASAPQRAAARECVLREPAAWIAQELVELSTEPTRVEDGTLQPRHVDLRAFAFADGAGGFAVPPVGLSRFALAAGDLVVNCSQGGGGKDVRVSPR
jgi:carboxylate-amine ligase